jgi:hypothetical protein
MGVMRQKDVILDATITRLNLLDLARNPVCNNLATSVDPLHEYDIVSLHVQRVSVNRRRRVPRPR